MPRIKAYAKQYALNDLSAYIKRRMRAQGKNQADLGRACGVSQQVMSKRLKENKLSASDLVSIFQCLNVDTETIGKLLKV